MNEKPLKALDLFCGAAGGWSLGLHRAGVPTLAAVEIDPWRQKVFKSNFPEVKIYSDIKTLSAARLAKDRIKGINLIVGSPPCQDASCANGKGKGIKGPRTGLFFEAIRLVREIQPRWVVFENVTGLKSRGIDRVLAQLEAAGYTATALVVGSWHAGAPHKRNRVWIVAHQKSLKGMGRKILSRTFQPQNPCYPRKDRCQPFKRRPLSAQSARIVTRGIKRSLGAWHLWNNGPPAYRRMDDGLPTQLDNERSLVRKALAAYGDAVTPQVTEAVIRSILTWENEAQKA